MKQDGPSVKLYVIHATSNAFRRMHYVAAPNKADAVRQGEILLGGGYLAQCTAIEVKVKGWKIILVEAGANGGQMSMFQGNL